MSHPSSRSRKRRGAAPQRLVADYYADNGYPHATDAGACVGAAKNYRLALPWPSPPLTANQRLSWPKRARITREVRTTTAWLIRAAKIPPADHVTLGLVYAPGDHRRRDADNLVPTLKACADALIDAGIVPDDTPRWTTKLMPTIEPPPHQPGLWLQLEPTGARP